MLTENIYKQLLLNQYITTQMQAGNTITPADIEEYKTATLEDIDLSVPQFDSDTYSTVKLENASAVKFNNTFLTIKNDLTVLYQSMIVLANNTTQDFERWKTELSFLEKRAIDLENEIDNLLLISQDTEGYHSFFVDNFTDLEWTDRTETEAMVDIASQQVYLSPLLTTSEPNTWLPMNNLQENDAWYINKTTQNLMGPPTITGKVSDIFNQLNKSWLAAFQAKVPPKSFIIEITVKLGEEPVDLTSIYLKLHSAAQSSPTTITPLYSIDNYNFQQLPSTSFSQDVFTQYTFNFPKIQAKWVKFNLAKPGYDFKRDDYYEYEFGFDSILFYGEIFDPDTEQVFISKPLYTLDRNSNVKEFSKVALEVCERVETNTAIRYEVMPSNISSVPVDNGVWYSISPLSRPNPEEPYVVDFGDVVAAEVGVDETITVSYDEDASDTDYINPAETFHLLSLDTDNTILDETITSIAKRYETVNANECILNYQIKTADYTGSGAGSAIDFNEDTIVVFRNVGEKGLTGSSTVRNVSRGWRYESPYYVTVIEVLNPNGIELDFGDQEVIIDDVAYKKKVVLSGKTQTSEGLHTIKVYKSNWLYVTPELDSLSALKSADLLYPYNHKLLIEGYDYGSSYPAASEQLYTGVDLFAAYKMTKVSPFDLSVNVPQDGYKYYALDYDVTNSHTSGNSPTRVFLVKVNNSVPDLINERFVVRFSLHNQRYQYLRLKATMSTTSADVSPTIDAYQIKFGD